MKFLYVYCKYIKFSKIFELSCVCCKKVVFQIICFGVILWRERLNSDSQQFHQYQQNEQWPFTSTHWT